MKIAIRYNGSEIKMEFHHIGIACKDIEKTKKYMIKLFDVKEISDTVYDELQEAHLCMLKLKDGTHIELISGRPTERLVKKGQFLYHTCYSTKNINKKIHEFEEAGATIIKGATPAILFNNRKVAFIYTELGILELIEAE